MKKILGIIGSPRKLGNSEIMVKEISKQISIPHELQLLRLTDFNILPCRACYRCLFKEEGCTQDDDFTTVLNAIVEANALIVATPTYFLGPNAGLKRFLDRGLAFYAHIETLWAKPAVGIAVAGINGKEGYTLLALESFLNLLFADVKQSKTIYGALPGEIFINAQNKKIAAGLASALFGISPERKGPCCPLCGGDTFRFLGDNQVRCMLCSNSGTVATLSDKPVFTIQKGEHELFLTKKEALQHREWLRGMRDRFIKQKSSLKKISLPYRKKGNWIQP